MFCYCFQGCYEGGDGHFWELSFYASKIGDHCMNLCFKNDLIKAKILSRMA